MRHDYGQHPVGQSHFGGHASCLKVLAPAEAPNEL